MRTLTHFKRRGDSFFHLDPQYVVFLLVAGFVLAALLFWYWCRRRGKREHSLLIAPRQEETIDVALELHTCRRFPHSCRGGVSFASFVTSAIVH